MRSRAGYIRKKEPNFYEVSKVVESTLRRDESAANIRTCDVPSRKDK